MQANNIIKVYPMLINVTLSYDYRSITNQKQTDAIELEHFIVEGVSGGGHRAATCAYIIPDWLSACGIIAGTGPIFSSTGEISRTNRITAFISPRMAKRIPDLKAKFYPNEEHLSLLLSQVDEFMATFGP